MKCKFVLDLDADVLQVPEDQKHKLAWRQVKDLSLGKMVSHPYWPAGTEYEHPTAHFLVDAGCAIPADLECELACRPISQTERARLELEYKATSLGINDTHDRELFFAGVIAGYERINGQLAYLPGPNYEAWKTANEKAQPKDDL